MTRLTLTCIALLSFNLVFAQKDKSKHRVDKKKAEMPEIRYEKFDYLVDTAVAYKMNVPLNSLIGIKITNVNKKLVTINKTVVKTNFNEEKPALFETVFKATEPAKSGGGAGFNAGDFEILSDTRDFPMTGLTDSLRTEINKAKSTYASIGTRLVDIDQAIDNFGTDYSHVKEILKYHSQLIQAQDICNMSFLAVVSYVNQLTKRIFTDNMRIDLPQADRASILNNSDYLANKGIIDGYITQVVGSAEGHHAAISAGFLPSNMDDIEKSIAQVNKKLQGIIAKLKTIKPQSPEVKNLVTALTAVLDDDILSEKLKDIKYKYAKVDFEKLMDNIKTFGIEGRKDLFATYDFFNESNYTYLLSPQEIDSDLVTLSVAIEPKDNVTCMPYARNYLVRIRPRHGIKIDFSTGLFGNFGDNNFIDQTYRFDSVQGQSGKAVLVKNNGKNRFYPTIGALMHIYQRNGRDMHFAGCFGVSTKDLDKINFHFGGSMIFGYSQRFVISTGITLSKTTLIEDKYYEGEVLDAANVPSTIPTSSFNRIGFFLAFTYNLSSK